MKINGKKMEDVLRAAPEQISCGPPRAALPGRGTFCVGRPSGSDAPLKTGTAKDRITRALPAEGRQSPLNRIKVRPKMLREKFLFFSYQ